MIFSWLQSRRRQRLLGRPLPDDWPELAERNVRHYRHLPSDLRSRLWEKVPIFIDEKDWTGCGDLQISEEIQVTVAVTACMMILGMKDDYCFDGVRSILVYPGAYAHPEDIQAGKVTGETPVFGESWHRGPIVLSWRHVLNAGGWWRGGRNLVVHEFAHHLDGLDGDVAGTPLLADRQQYRSWYRVTEAEYFRLVGSAQRGEIALLDHYGASNRAEFFAVATECFFELPRAMSRRHEALYGVLRDFYQIDPAEWLPDARDEKPPGQDDRPRRGRRGKGAVQKPTTGQSEDEAVEVDSAYRRSAEKDHDFTCGVVHINHEQFAEAVAAFSRVLKVDPDDAEAHHHRALALLNLARYDESLADCNRAIELDPGDGNAYRIRGIAHVGLEEYQQAVADLDRALDDYAADAEAYYQRGRARAGLGQFRRAIADYSHAIRLDRFDAEFYYYRGLAYEQIGKEDKSRADMEKAEQLDPEAMA